MVIDMICNFDYHGMEVRCDFLPEACTACPFWGYSVEDDMGRCILTGTEIKADGPQDEKRMDDCILKEKNKINRNIPKITRLFERMEEEIQSANECGNFKFADGIGFARELVGNFLGQNVRKHAKWIIPKDVMWHNPYCSECGKESADHGLYCPYCGSRMDDDREEERKNTDKLQKDEDKPIIKFFGNPSYYTRTGWYRLPTNGIDPNHTLIFELKDDKGGNNGRSDKD